MTTEELIQQLRWRYATKVFDPTKQIDDKTWDAIEDSLTLTPSSFGLQPWKFIVVTDQATKERLLDYSWNQRQVVDCSHLVVLCAHASVSDDELEKLLQHTIEARGGDREALQGYHDMMKGFISRMSDEQLLFWSKHQVYIALGQLMATAAMLKVDACPMEGIVPTEYDRILGLEDTSYRTVVACPLGYRSEDDKYADLPKVRYPKKDIIERI
ncbi:oxygen-insensitive NAD(P)H nitroreductase [Rubritalea halochordaticola]|uniref:Oxygen-insensitive NAD(P)H nitroreductase n=1 Tax=Rubritalea halochordaticola TaxID=714537 RepID=A0ABP9UZQ8_9BACT